MKLSRRKFLISGLLLTGGAVAGDAFWIEKYFIETNEYFIGSSTIGAPNIKVVQLSDLHLQSLNKQLIQLAKKINKWHPDLICLTGDAIDKAGNISILDLFLKLIDKDIQKVAILGNWEYWGGVDIDELKNIYADHNCKLLINETSQFSFRGQTISITGVDDFIGGKADINLALKNYVTTDYHIILNHCPQSSDQITVDIRPDIKVDFILCGHTHGGQINLFGFVPFLPQGSGKYLRGWYENHPIKMYVSKGIGTSIFPARFGTRAEVAIFNLTASE